MDIFRSLKMKHLLPLILLLSLFYACDKDTNKEEEIYDALNETHILGEWNIEFSYATSRPSTLLFDCCQSITFTADDNHDDYLGTFKAVDHGDVFKGVFSIDVDNALITYYKNSGNTLITPFRLDNNNQSLHLDFTKDNMTVCYRKQ